MDAEAFHEAERARDGAVRHHPHDHVHAFGRQADEVPEIVMRGLRLRKGAVRLFLDGMDHVRELDGVLDEEHRDVVADDVPVAFLGIELDGKAAHVARQVERTLAAGDGGEPHKGRRSFAGALEQIGAGVFRQRLVVLEEAMRAVAARMHDPLGNALVVEMENLLAEMEVLDQRRPARADLERVLVVRDRAALRRGQDRRIACPRSDAVRRPRRGSVSDREWLLHRPLNRWASLLSPRAAPQNVGMNSTHNPSQTRRFLLGRCEVRAWLLRAVRAREKYYLSRRGQH